MAVEDLTFDNLIKEKMTYVIPTLGKTYYTEEDAKTMVCKTANIGQYYKFYEVFYAPSDLRRSKRYTKFMMIMTRRTIAIHNEVQSYMKETLGLDPVIFLSDEWGWRDNYIINETDYTTATQVFNAIQKCMKTDGGCEPGGNELIDGGVGTLHLIKYDGTLIYAGTPSCPEDIIDTYVNYDPDKQDDDEPQTDIDIDGDYQ